MFRFRASYGNDTIRLGTMRLLSKSEADSLLADFGMPPEETV
jgi:hypothetical protein